MADTTLQSLAQGSPGLGRVAVWVEVGLHSRRGWLGGAYSLDTVLDYRLHLGILALPKKEESEQSVSKEIHSGSKPGHQRN